MAQQASVLLEPCKKKFVSGIGEYHAILKAGDFGGLSNCIEKIEESKAEFVKEVRKVLLGIKDQNAKSSLLKATQDLDLKIAQLKTITKSSQSQGDVDQLLDATLEVAKGLQDIMSISAAMTYTPPETRPLSMMKTNQISDRRRSEVLQSPVSPSQVRLSIASTISISEDAYTLPFQYEEWKARVESLLQCAEKMSFAIDHGRKDEFPTISESILETAGDCLDDVNEVDTTKIDPSLRDILQRNVDNMNSNMTTLKQKTKIATGAWPPEGIDHELKISTISVAVIVKKLMSTVQNIATDLIQRQQPRTPNSVNNQTPSTTQTSHVPHDWFDQEIEELQMHFGISSAIEENHLTYEELDSLEQEFSRKSSTSSEASVQTQSSDISQNSEMSQSSQNQQTMEQTVEQNETPKENTTQEEKVSSPKNEPRKEEAKPRKKTISGSSRQGVLKSFFSTSLSKIIVGESNNSQVPPIQRSRSDADVKKQKMIEKQNEEELIQLENEIVSNENILFKTEKDQKEVKAGSLEKLIEYLTWHRSPDLVYNNTFLLTYRSFTTPSELLKLLMKRFEIEPPEAIKSSESLLQPFQEKIASPVQLRVLIIMKHWLDKHFYDFEDDDELRKTLEKWVDDVATKKNPGISKQLKKLISKNNSKKQEKMTLESNPFLNITGDTILNELEKIDELDLAKQLTALEFSLYTAIQPKELLNQSWNDYKKTQIKSNVNKMIDSFNDISKWVASEIVTGANERKRSATLKYFITVGQHCEKFQNYNALMAIVAGINGSAVHRLKKTWDVLSPKKKTAFEELQNVMSQQNNYATLRNVLHSVEPPCIPYLGMYLTDLTFLEDGNPDMVEQLINFDKRRKVSFVIREVQQYQQIAYNIPVDQDIQKFIQIRKQKILNDDQLYERSLVAEPRK